jgi:HTH-type transcriptional regulator / antitoxin HipB
MRIRKASVLCRICLDTPDETTFLTKIKMRVNRLKNLKLDQAAGKLIGKRGIYQLEEHEFELNLESLGAMVRAARLERNLNQDQFSEVLGVEKSQLSRLEKNASDVSVEMILRVFSVLKAKINFKVEENQNKEAKTLHN